MFFLHWLDKKGLLGIPALTDPVHYEGAIAPILTEELHQRITTTGNRRNYPLYSVHIVAAYSIKPLGAVETIQTRHYFFAGGMSMRRLAEGDLVQDDQPKGFRHGFRAARMMGRPCPLGKHHL